MSNDDHVRQFQYQPFLKLMSIVLPHGHVLTQFFGLKTKVISHLFTNIRTTPTKVMQTNECYHLSRIIGKQSIF